MIHAQLDTSGVCIGFSNLKDIESRPNLVFLPDGWDEYFLWRKYENGQWSAEKFEPPVVPSGPSAEEQIAVLDERTVGMQAIDDFTLQAQATIDERTVGMQEIDDFTLLQVVDLQQQVDQLKADIAALKGGA